MSSIEELSNHYNYLDDILTIFGDIYNKCPCQPCIESSAEKILSFIPNIQEFYYFLIDNKNFIKQNETYLTKIQELIPKMISFNTLIIHDIVLINTQISVSVIYIEAEELCEPPFNNETLYKYYPELKI